MGAVVAAAIFSAAGAFAVRSLIEDFLKAARHFAIVQPYQPHET